MMKEFWKWYLSKLSIHLISIPGNIRKISIDTYTEWIIGAVIVAAGFFSGIIVGIDHHPFFFLLFLLILVGITIIYHSNYREKPKGDS